MASRKDDKDERREDENPAEKATRAAAMQASRMTERAMGQGAEFGRLQQNQMQALFGASRGLAESGNMDAVMQSRARFAKGMQDLSWEMMQFTQQSLRLSLKTANDMMSCRSVENMLEIQRDYLRESVDTFLEESAKMLEMGTNVATEAVEPIEKIRPAPQ